MLLQLLRIGRLSFLGAFLCLSTAAAQTGAIEGVITEAQSGVPVPGANVVIEDANLGAASGANGQYVIEQVPAGDHTVTVRFVGYRTINRTVTVAAGQTLTVDFQMEEEALGLDEIVVTGTAGQARRKEVGNSISSIDTRDLESPPTDLDELITGQAPGVTVNLGEGMSGSGAQIRLRGNTSISQSNAPLIYVDGIRMRSDGYPKNVPPVGYSGRSANVTANPLNDINPNDIERIEIIKGAAATTLYGTEAASGVIQIFTKTGTAGDASWSFQAQQGFTDMQAFGPSNAPFMRVDPWLSTAHQQKYSGSVRGGVSELRYFVSGTYTDGQGVLPDDSQEKFNVRGNFSFSPFDELQLNWNTSYTSDDVQNPPAGNNAQGLTLNALRGNSNYFGDYNKGLIDQLLDYKVFTNLDHLVTGGSALYQPFDNLSNRLTIGYDRAEMELRQYRPFGFILAPQGIMSNEQWVSTTLTFEYVGNLEFDITPDLTSRLSIGGQSVTTNTTSVTGYAEEFSAPGEPTLSSGAATLSFEDRIRVINAGFFAQNLLGFKDRYFLTLGLRVDGNSAFGSDFGLQPYPKASLSYVISDESFWGDDWGSLKLRAAYGHAGRAPGAFDAVRTWSAAGWGGQPAFLPNTVGNADLGPERTVETEVGFDAGLFNERLGIDFTYYHQVTDDALLPVAQIPSRGFLTSQLENVGRVRNRGIELGVDGTLLDGAQWGFELGGTLSTNFSSVLDLGGAPSFEISGGGWIEEGSPAPAIRGRRILNPDAVAEPDFLTDEDGDITFDIWGPNVPTRTVSLKTTLRMPFDISLSARAEYQGGHFINDGASNNMARRAPAPDNLPSDPSQLAWPGCTAGYTALANGNRGQLTAIDRARCDVTVLSGAYSTFVYPADFVKLRDLTLRVPLPLAANLVRTASFSLSLRNVRLWLHEDFAAFDPEMTGQEGLGQSTRAITEHIPAPYSVTATINVTL